ncbi:MAG: hydrogenase maturation nickel metallochaperone HypA [Burkholderiaceae bacterium]|nr:hydrogenase maturation nickel metallochaperone HypA [Burkholderiaceae bacterium]
MHELSLAASILDIVEVAARREAFAAVRRLHLAVPALCGVEVEALRFALQAVAPGTLIEGAEILIERPAARAQCGDCSAEVEVEDHGECCPRCGGGRLRVRGGAGLQVLDLMVA